MQSLCIAHGNWEIHPLQMSPRVPALPHDRPIFKVMLIFSLGVNRNTSYPHVQLTVLHGYFYTQLMWFLILGGVQMTFIRIKNPVFVSMATFLGIIASQKRQRSRCLAFEPYRSETNFPDPSWSSVKGSLIICLQVPPMYNGSFRSTYSLTLQQKILKRDKLVFFSTLCLLDDFVSSFQPKSTLYLHRPNLPFFKLPPGKVESILLPHCLLFAVAFEPLTSWSEVHLLNHWATRPARV